MVNGRGSGRGPYRIGVLTSGRADYSILCPLLQVLRADALFDLKVIAFGMHLMAEHGNSVEQIEADGYTVCRVAADLPGESPRATAENMAHTTAAFAEFYEAEPLDLVVALGDRYEMFAAVAASVPFNVPVAHFHGGEETAGAIDDAFRHAISCMSTLHLTSHRSYAARVKAIVGEARSDAVHAVGALGIDSLLSEKLLDPAAFQERFGVDLTRPTALVTFHPETRRGRAGLDDAAEVIAALEAMDEQILLTVPNADPYGVSIREMFIERLRARGNAAWFDMLGRKGYYSAMAHCSLLVGNSSSGIIEAASFGKPVVDIGDRQAGRLHGDNVLHCLADREAILSTVARARSMGPLPCENIYGDGRAAERAVAIMADWLTRETKR